MTQYFEKVTTYLHDVYRMLLSQGDCLTPANKEDAMESKLDRVYNVLHIFGTCRSAPFVGLYLLLIVLSPLLMKLLPPMQLRKVLMAHNFICWTLSVYAVLALSIGLWNAGDLFSMEHTEGWLRHGIFIYWISKFVELMDTVYMILRHRTRQISCLHVWHHSSITLLADWGYTRASWPAIAPLVALNSCVHIFMYGYYFLTALYPLHDFTWKKRITQFQIVQFLIGIAHAIYGYMFRRFCVYSILYALGMLLLFSNYYYWAFLGKSRGKKKEEDKDS